MFESSIRFYKVKLDFKGGDNGESKGEGGPHQGDLGGPKGPK